MKVPWPLSAREALIHCFEFEYLKDGLVIVVLNSISDLDNIDKSTHGFTRDGIPNPDDVVRIDVVGGFALQKVSAGRSYFRTIANIDIKLDFMPPAFINFVSRQLIGSGFKLYKKEVASVAQGDEDFANALKDSLYEEIREAFYSDNVSLKKFELEETKHDGGIMLDEQPKLNNEDMKVKEEIQSDAQITRMEISEVEEIPDKACDLVEEHRGTYNKNAEAEKNVQIDDRLSRHAENFIVRDEQTVCEIEVEIGEADTEEGKHVDTDWKTSSYPETNQTTEKSLTDDNKVIIHPEVEKALGILEKAISIIREHRSNHENESLPKKTVEKQNLGGTAKKESTSSKPDQFCQNGATLTGLSEKDSTDTTSREARTSSGSHGSRRIGSNSFARESNHSKVAPASLDEFVQHPGETNHHDTALFSFDDQIGVASTDKSTVSVETTGTNKKNKKSSYCCLHYIYGQQAARA